MAVAGRSVVAYGKASHGGGMLFLLRLDLGEGRGEQLPARLAMG